MPSETMRFSKKRIITARSVLRHSHPGVGYVAIPHQTSNLKSYLLEAFHRKDCPENQIHHKSRDDWNKGPYHKEYSDRGCLPSEPFGDACAHTGDDFVVR